jgi:hypothetical protein
MIYRVLADLVVLLHFSFVLFAVLGGLLVWRWRFWIWFHLPAVLWAVLIEFAGWICPLTPLENYLRTKSGIPGYEIGFVEHYIMPLLYPAQITRTVQVVLGLLVLVLNLVIYYLVWQSYKTSPKSPKLDN